MAVSRKDFNAAAKIVHNVYRCAGFDAAIAAHCAFVVFFQASNPRFSRLRFLDACNLDNGRIVTFTASNTSTETLEARVRIGSEAELEATRDAVETLANQVLEYGCAVVNHDSDLNSTILLDELDRLE